MKMAEKKQTAAVPITEGLFFRKISGGCTESMQSTSNKVLSLTLANCDCLRKASSLDREEGLSLLTEGLKVKKWLKKISG